MQETLIKLENWRNRTTSKSTLEPDSCYRTRNVWVVCTLISRGWQTSLSVSSIIMIEQTPRHFVMEADIEIGHAKTPSIRFPAEGIHITHDHCQHHVMPWRLVALKHLESVPKALRLFGLCWGFLRRLGGVGRLGHLQQERLMELRQC